VKVIAAVKTRNSLIMNLRIAPPIRYVGAMETRRNILAFIILIAGVIWLIHRERVACDGWTPMERKDLDYQEREILSMLRQHRGPMMQSGMIDMSPGDLENIAGVMKGMESRGLIQCEWRSD